MSIPANLEAWTAFVLAALALSKQVYDYFQKRKKDREDVEEALSRNEEVRKQLEIGNLDGAVRVLTKMMETQSKHYDERERQRDKRELELESEIEDLRTLNSELKRRVMELKERVLELEHAKGL